MMTSLPNCGSGTQERSQLAGLFKKNRLVQQEEKKDCQEKATESCELNNGPTRRTGMMESFSRDAMLLPIQICYLFFLF
jgi:hypothetical protein